MPTLANPLHEAFAHDMAKRLIDGTEYDSAARFAYCSCGWLSKPRQWRSNAKRLSHSDHISNRIAEVYEGLLSAAMSIRIEEAYERAMKAELVTTMRSPTIQG